MSVKNYEDVLNFWYDEKYIPLHFEENDEFDELVRREFLETWEAGKEGLLVDWRKNIKGRVAEIIVLDQFSRNLFREDIRAYTQDKMAIALAQEVVMMDQYKELSDLEKKNVLLPFMHSESTKLHDWAYKYYLELDDEKTLFFEDKHRAILDRFGRYPYQNEDLGRKSTPEEKAFLEEKDGDFFDMNEFQGND